MISTIASSYEAAANLRPREPHCAWKRAWERLREDHQRGLQIQPGELGGYLAEVPLEDQQECAYELIAEHLRLYSCGGKPMLEDYIVALQRELPLPAAALLPADLVEDEFLVRSTPPRGDYPRLDSYLSRFLQRADIHERLARRCLADQRYVKLRVLGVGAFGVVYEAYDSTLDRLVAVKETNHADAAAKQRLLKEMQLTAELDHPGIVPVYDYGPSDEGAFFAMGLVTGQSLSERLGEYHRQLPTRSASENRQQLHGLIERVIQMCNAAAHAHERGILHRDLKPGNVLVRDSGEAVIIDWGLAQRAGQPGPGLVPANRADPESIIAGTPQYMAPEQVARQEIPASDIFSLGATLYEVITGRPPYHWSADFLPVNWQETVREARIVPPRRIVSSTPKELDAICTKALAKSPAERYATAAELGADLRRFLESASKSRGWWPWL